MTDQLLVDASKCLIYKKYCNFWKWHATIPCYYICWEKKVWMKYSEMFYLQTYASAHDNSSGQEEILVPGDSHTQGPDREHHTGRHDDGPPPQPVVQEAPNGGKKGSSGDRDADDALLPDERELELVPQENHGARNHARIISKQKSPEGREKSQHVNKPGGALLWRETVNFQAEFFIVRVVVETARPSSSIAGRTVQGPSRRHCFVWMLEKRKFGITE